MSEQMAVSRARLEQAIAALTRKVGSGGRWFYWIAGLSLINSITAYSGLHFTFVIGLNITQIFDAFAMNNRFAAAKSVFIAMSLITIGLYALFGFFATKCKQWAFVTGFVLYILDTALFLLALVGGADSSLALTGLFHLWALYGIYQGMKANGLLSKLERQAASAPLQEPALAGHAILPPPYQPAAEPEQTKDEPAASVDGGQE